MKDTPRLGEFSIIQSILFFSLLVVGTSAFIWLINDFLMPIFWAIVLAIVFHPVHTKWLLLLKREALASLCTLLTIIVIIFAPLWFIGGLVVDESLRVYERISSADVSSSRISLIEHTVMALGKLESYGIKEKDVKEKLVSFGQTASAWVAEQAIVFGQATFGVLISFFLMLYVLFFLLRDGRGIEEKVLRVLPLGHEREKILFRNFVLVTRSIFKGTLVIALVQGAIGGILFYIAGIESALLWAVVMALLSVIPAVGPGIVWLPAGIVLLISGAYVQAAVVLLGGAIIISLIDNILRPILIRRDIHMPDMIVLVSTLGGLALFGITGFIIGPVIAGFFFSMWSIFERDYQRELEMRG
ncbi:AI-2E family transporter [Candidatus Kaiserbacteria bacterium]|nr:AI-2E family transporter [Candidatus Kaiserbacteria bacterium]